MSLGLFRRFGLTAGGGGVGIEFIGSSDYAGASAGSFATPVGTAEGDLMFLWCVRRANSTNSNPEGGGWTLRLSDLSGDTRVQLYTKTAGASEAATITTALGGFHAGNLMVFRNAAITTILQATAGGFDNPTIPSVTGSEGSVLVGLWGSASGSVSAMTPPAEMVTIEISVSGTSIACSSAYEVMLADGATPPRTTTGGGSRDKAVAVLLNAA